jgi:hypothetical protein
VSEKIWYHGRTVKSAEFKEEFTGKGTDQEGPGFYFTDDPIQAAGYAYPDGVIITAKLKLRKELPEKAKTSDIKFLLENSPNYEYNLSNWHEDPKKAASIALKAMLDQDDVYQQVWVDFYRYDPEDYLKNLVKLGYDGHSALWIKRHGTGDVEHMVVYNPKAIEVLEVTPYKDWKHKTGSKVSSSFVKALASLVAEPKALGSLTVSPVEVVAFTSETYWTCFAYDGVHPDELHCTHKYFKDQTPETMEQIRKIIDEHFKAKPFEPFTTRFDQVNMFGENKDVRVLRPAVDDLSLYHLDLKEKLDEFREDRFPDYCPHVTTDLDVVEMPFARYCLLQGSNVLAEWKAPAVAAARARKV